MADSTSVHARRSIGAHGVIGDLRTCALVATDGTIDHFCWPNLDSPSIFAALLDSEKAGYFSLAPLWDDAREQQLYLPDTNILQTRWLAAEGVAEVTDLMPVCSTEDTKPRIVRRVQMVAGKGRIRLHCAPAHDYARATTRARRLDDGALFEADGQPTLRLASPVPLEVEGNAAFAEFELQQGESLDFVFGCAEDDKVTAGGSELCFQDTLTYWTRWAAKSQYQGRWREMVTRSALALKLLTSCKHGSIAAAATFSLPEALGGERNWDYRASWIRDSSFTVYAFMRLGYTEEAKDFIHWVGHCMENSHQEPERLQIMYRLDGGLDLPEESLEHLAGYADSSPVRIGNEAYKQTQLDIYGELMDAVYLSNKYGEAISHQRWRHVVRMIDHVCEVWNTPDAGIWEMRGEPEHFLHSRLMCWVAIDRALRLAVKRSLPMPYEHWYATRSAIQEDIWDNFWSDELGHFTATRQGKSLDAAMLLMPLVRFVSATDPQWLATLDAIKQHLTYDGMIRRYDPADTPADNLDGEEGAFVACSFWYVECLARAGRVDEAHLEFEKLLGYANPLGLYAEELDKRGYPLGNVPQALSHLALISAAFFLDRKLSGKDPQWQP